MEVEKKLIRFYTITSELGNMVYVGSTERTLQLRYNEHKCPSRNNPMSKILFAKYGIDNCKISEIFQKECCKTERNKIEAEYIRQYKLDDTYNCVNVGIPGRTTNEYYIDNKDKFKQYRSDNKEKYRNIKRNITTTIKKKYRNIKHNIIKTIKQKYRNVIIKNAFVRVERFIHTLINQGTKKTKFHNNFTININNITINNNCTENINITELTNQIKEQIMMAMEDN